MFTFDSELPAWRDGGSYAPRASSALWAFCGIILALIRNTAGRAELSPRISPSGSNVATHTPIIGLKDCCRSDARSETRHDRGARKTEHRLNHCTRCVGTICDYAVHWSYNHGQFYSFGKVLYYYYYHDYCKMYESCDHEKPQFEGISAAAAYKCEALPASGSVGALSPTPVEELESLSPDGEAKSWTIGCPPTIADHYDHGYTEPKLTTQNLHKWWYRCPRDVLTQQGIEPHPGPVFTGSSGSKGAGTVPNPAPKTEAPQPFHIVSRNIRGVYKNLGNAIRTRADVICLQEADIFESEVGGFCAQALVAGYIAPFADTVPLTRDGVGAHGRRTALLIRNTITSTDVTDHDDQNIQALLRTGRYIERLLPVGNDGAQAIVASFYGIPGASAEGQVKKDNDRYVAMAALRVKQLKRIPYFLGKDMNVNPKQSPQTQACIKAGIWHDIFDDAVIGEPAPTFSRGGVHATTSRGPVLTMCHCTFF